jgi:hypothetical protein
MVVKFINTIWPPPPQLFLHRRAALSSNSNGTRSYVAERTQNGSLYYEMSVFAIDWKNNSKTKVEKVFFFIFMSSYAEMSF